MHFLKKTQLAPAAIGLSLVCLLGAGCKSKQFGNHFSPSEERDMGAEAAVNIDTQVKLDMDGKLNRRILDIATPIFAQAEKEIPGTSFRIRVVDDSTINAFSIPGGYVYIYRGLLDKLGNDDDAIACVIGHEASHVVRHHVVKQISDAQGKGALVDLATILSRSYGVGQVGGTLAELDQLHYSRQDEYEADRWGERFAYNAGYSPMGMLRTFHILEEVERQSGGTPAYAEDHPITKNRTLRAAEQLRELRANNGQYLTEEYDPAGDQKAAKKSGIDYQSLVLATTPVTPAPTPMTAGSDTKK